MKQITRLYVRLFMLVMPMLFLPVVIDAFGFGKNVMLMVLTMVGLVIWLLEMLIGKKDAVKVNKTWLLMAAVTVWAWVGWYRLEPGLRMKSLTDLTGVGMLTSGLAWFFLWLQVTNEEEKKKQLDMLTVSGVITMLVSIVIFLIPNSKLPLNIPKVNPLISINSTWSLTGSILSELILMLFLVVEWGKRLIVKLKSENYIMEAVATSMLSLGMFLDIFKIFRNGWVNLDGVTAWSVAVETFKRSPIWGVGPGNFTSAFNLFRPESYNLTATWANGFLHSNTGILNLWTELGIVGVVAVLLALGGLVKLKKNYDFGVLVLMVLVGMFLPVNLVAMLLLVWTAATVSTESKKMGLMLKIGENGFNVAPWILSVVLTGGTMFGGYWMFRIIAADIYMRQSLVAAAKNDGGLTYNLQIKAIGLNPTSADYRRMYSQTNLALASNLLTNKDITDEDKQKASTLIQQSVREAKAAISLDANNPSYWSNLAVVYRQLVGVVDGSADWSFQAYQQAAALEPANPMTKLDLGGLLFAAKRYDEADRVFEQVVTAKPDFANGWYNWAYSAKAMNKLDYAVQRLSQAVALVPQTSGDFEKANTELATWKKELDEAIKKQQAQQQVQQPPKVAETLKAPEPLPTAGKEEKVNVPATDLAPPSVQVTPEVSPSPKP